jgi:hypothetical protein
MPLMMKQMLLVTKMQKMEALKLRASHMLQAAFISITLEIIAGSMSSSIMSLALKDLIERELKSLLSSLKFITSQRKIFSINKKRSEKLVRKSFKTRKRGEQPLLLQLPRRSQASNRRKRSKMTIKRMISLKALHLKLSLT